jgi:hypothetical protein
MTFYIFGYMLLSPSEIQSSPQPAPLLVLFPMPRLLCGHSRFLLMFCDTWECRSDLHRKGTPPHKVRLIFFPTGESIPVTKTPLSQTASSVPWKMQSEADPRRHVLFCGTEVIQAKAAGSGAVRAVVLQTGEHLLGRSFVMMPAHLVCPLP